MTKNAASDEVLSVSDLLAMVGSARATGKSFHTVADSVTRRVMDNIGQDPWEAVPMILVKHRWMKGRSTVSNNTVLSFGMDGVARVKNVGDALRDVEQYIRTARGAAEIFVPEEQVSQDPKPVVTPPAVPVAPRKVEESQPVVVEAKPVNEVEVAAPVVVGDDAVQEPFTKKMPPKKRKI